MKIYISGSEDPEKRKKVAEILCKNGHVVVDGKKQETKKIVLSKRGKLEIRLSLIPKCDTIFMMEGWQNHDIAKIEFDKAVEERLIICFEDGKTAKECVE